MTDNTAPGDAGGPEKRARENQAERNTDLKATYDFIICGAGAAGSVIARRLAENPACSVLLIEAGRDDEAESVLNPALWPTNLGTDRDWGFQAEPNPHLDGRALSMSMGKGLGGGSSVNVMVWARGHRSDWDYFAAETGDPDWNYASVLDIYRRIENWQGRPDAAYRGTTGPVWVQPAKDPSPIAGALLDAAEGLGIPRFDHPNGEMMEGVGGVAYADMLVREGRRHSLYRAYVRPIADRPNMTILTETMVRRVLFDGRRAVGVEVERAGSISAIKASTEVVISTGAINTPKLLMLSGVGDRDELARLGIPVVQHLPGVGRNLQDHVSFGCTWEYREPLPPRNSGSEATLYWKSRPDLTAPDLLFCQVEAIVDLHWLHDRPMVVVQIDDQERLARTIGQDVVTVDTQTIRASRSNPAAGVQAFRPLMSALEQAVTDDAAAGIDVGATQIAGVAAFASLSDLDGELREMGFEGYAFVPAVAAPEAIAQAGRTIGMLAQSLPLLRPVLVENRRDGNFDSLAAGSEAYRALLRLRAAYPSLPEIVMPAIEAGSWRHFEPHFCRPIVVASMDIAEVMRLTGLPKAEAKIAKGDVAAWVAEMERALAPLLDLPEVFR